MPLIRYHRETFNARGISHATSPRRIRARGPNVFASLVRLPDSARPSIDEGEGIKRGLKNHPGNTSALSAIRASNLRRRKRPACRKREKKSPAGYAKSAECAVSCSTVSTPFPQHNTAAPGERERQRYNDTASRKKREMGRGVVES